MFSPRLPPVAGAEEGPATNAPPAAIRVKAAPAGAQVTSSGSVFRPSRPNKRKLKGRKPVITSGVRLESIQLATKDSLLLKQGSQEPGQAGPPGQQGQIGKVKRGRSFRKQAAARAAEEVSTTIYKTDGPSGVPLHLKLPRSPTSHKPFTPTPPLRPNITTARRNRSGSMSRTRPTARLKVEARKALEPKLVADINRRERGKTPREVLIERVRRDYSASNVEGLLYEAGVDTSVAEYHRRQAAASLAKAAAAAGSHATVEQQYGASSAQRNLDTMEERLPVEAFDDSSYDIHTNEQWAELIPVARCAFSPTPVEAHLISPLDESLVRMRPPSQPASPRPPSATRHVKMPSGFSLGNTSLSVSTAPHAGTTPRLGQSATSPSAAAGAAPATSAEVQGELKARALLTPEGVPFAHFAGEWRQCAVTRYDAETDKFVVKWSDDTTATSGEGSGERLPPAHLPRLRICFNKESPKVFARRVAAAFRARKQAMARLQYNLYVDCMPLDGVGEPPEDQLQRILAACRGSGTGHNSTMAMASNALLYEVRMDWQRTMNKVLFDKMREEAASKAGASSGEQAQGQHLGVQDGDSFAAVPATIHAGTQLAKAKPYYGMVQCGAPSFAALSSAFAFNTCLTQPEVVDALREIHGDCAKVLSQTLIATEFSRSMLLDDFRTEQWKWIGSRCDRLKNDWTLHIAQHIMRGLSAVGKGWFNVNEDNRQVYEFSKLRRLLQMVRLVMQDTLRDLTNSSLDKYVRMMRHRTICDVSVRGVAEVRHEWALDPDEGKGPVDPLAEHRQMASPAHIAQLSSPRSFISAAKSLEGETLERRQRVSAMLRPPPLFEVELKVPEARVLLNGDEVRASHAARAEWKAHQRAVRQGQWLEAGGDGHAPANRRASVASSVLPPEEMPGGEEEEGQEGVKGVTFALGPGDELDARSEDDSESDSDAGLGELGEAELEEDSDDVSEMSSGDEQEDASTEGGRSQLSRTAARSKAPKPAKVLPRYGYAFKYSHEGEEFVELSLACISKVLQGVGDIKDISPLIMRKLFFSTVDPIAAVATNEPQVAAAVEEVRELVTEACKPLRPYLRTFDQFISLLNLDVAQEIVRIEEGIHQNLDLMDLVLKVRFHRKEEERLLELLPRYVDVGCFRINISSVRDTLAARHKDMADGIMEKMSTFSSFITRRVQDETQAAKQRLRSRTATIEELSDLRGFMSNLKSTIPQFRGQLNQAVETRDALEEFCYRIDPENKTQLWRALESQELLVQQMSSVSRVLDVRQEAMAEDMLVEQSAFQDQLERLHREIYEFNNLTDLGQMENNYRRVQTVESRLAAAEAQVALYNSRERLFGMSVTPYRELRQSKAHFQPFKLLWSTAHRWSQCEEEFLRTPIMHLSAAEVERETGEARSNMAQCCRLFFRMQNARCLGVAEQVKAGCDAFAPNVKFVTGLRTEGLRDRHWQEMTKVLGFKVHQGMQHTLPELLEKGVAEHGGELDRIAQIASREYQLETSLQEMGATWAALRLQVVAYKDSGTFILTEVGDLMALLDEHITNTQSMQFSAYKAPFEDQIEHWGKRLTLASEVLDEWLQVQNTWLYLAPIFDSEDIATELPTETKRFATVDTNWRRTLSAAHSAADAISFLASEKLLQKFKESMRFLDTVQKGLAEHLETKRKAFPRFYFLSDDDLLQILSQTKEVARVQDHLPKCFEGVHRVQFARKQQLTSSLSFRNGRSKRSLFRTRTQRHLDVPQAQVNNDCHIVALQSKAGERLPLHQDVIPGGDSVEVWMTAVENVMRDSVRFVIEQALKASELAPRRKWVLEWPQMAVLAANQVRWTAAVEQALREEDAAAALEELHELQLAELEEVVALVRGKLSKRGVLAVGALSVLDVHSRDVVQRLQRQEVTDPLAFGWVRNMRYYWRDEDVAVEMATCARGFGYEYLGNSLRLVVTPLTEKCYLTCMTAMQLTLGGAPAGPAGTGKTETVKDLAKALATQCVVFNCSEGLNYLAMGKFFKGLALCGAWACFDEFNRIDVEVLSVVAQQIITLQTAVRSGVTDINFEGTELRVSGRFSVFITMNPGYVGRTELPGNLKALFRPVAMMVPDYALIGEIMFFAYGFSQSRVLAQKMVSTFQLCSEQLSAQSHYDYGMRAVKSVIAASGKLRKAHPEADEQQLLLQALREVNIPKFLAQDLPLFHGIISDLFPRVAARGRDSRALQGALAAGCREQGMQAVPYFMAKCVQLHHTLNGRHGVMVVGPSGGGKSTALKVLAYALIKLNVEGVKGERYERVQTSSLNPKAITMGELYGEVDVATREWKDGVLAAAVRRFSRDHSKDSKWVVCDGPVDADWVENLNTALDDNKKLCLPSGQIIRLPSQLNIVFEVDGLEQASPATVSRCGMVYFEPRLLGVDPQLMSWIDELKESGVAQPMLAALQGCCDVYLHTALSFARRRCGMAAMSDSHVVSSLVALLQPAITPLQRIYEAGGEAVENATVKPAALAAAHFHFALVWSLGAGVPEQHRASFSGFVRTEMLHHGHPLPYPAAGSVYDYFLQPGLGGEWASWDSARATASVQLYEPGKDFSDIFVASAETVQIAHLLGALLPFGRHVVLQGGTGTGKSVNILRYLTRAEASVIPLTFVMSARTTAAQLRSFVDDRCEKRRRHLYGPPIGSTFVCFLDDLNMPRPGQYGAQPALELLRQWMTYGGWHDMRTTKLRQIVDSTVVAAMGLPGGGRHAVSPRLLRHMNVVGLTTLPDSSLEAIFGSILASFTAAGFHSVIKELVQPLTKASIALYRAVQGKMLPTPSRPHYTFNLRDLSGILAGMLMVSPGKIEADSHKFLRLWLHESRRVLGDRLVSAEDVEWFAEQQGEVLRQHVGEELGQVLTVKALNADEAGADEEGAMRGRVAEDRLLWGDYVGPRAADEYDEMRDLDNLVPLFEEFLQDYNLESKVPMKLVMFLEAIEHISRVVRILRQPFGNALLLGVGGSGRQSATKLAAFMAEFQLSQIEISKGYSMYDWHDDVKRVLLRCGLEDKPTVFLLVDTQIIHEGMLEDVNNLLNSGDIPGLYSSDEVDQILEGSKFSCQLKGVPGTKLNLFNEYITKLRRNLHLVVAMTPVGETFRQTLRLFPALVNCCTIDWFAAWPDEALEWVADSELGFDTRRAESMSLPGSRPTAEQQRQAVASRGGTPAHMVAISRIVPAESHDALLTVVNCMHQSTIEVAGRFQRALRRHTYVTPASYLEFLRILKALLLDTHAKLDAKLRRLETGLSKLQYTKVQVNTMRESLVQLRPELEATQGEVDEMMVQIHEDRLQADATKAVVEQEEAVARSKAEKTRAIADDAQRDLDAVLPLLDAALECVNNLKRQDIDEVRSMVRPPAGVQVTMEAACIMFGVKPASKRNAMGQVEQDYWEAAKGELLRDARAFLQRMFHYDRDAIPEKVIKAIEPYIDRDEFQPREVERVNKASAGVCLWVRAMYQYHHVLKAVEPKKASLAAAQAELDRTLVSLAEAKARMAAVNARVAELQQKYDDAIAHKESLSAQISRCVLRLESAQKLLSGLGSEASRWHSTAGELRAAKQTMIGDCLLSAATIGYIGPFSADFREECIGRWRGIMQQCDMPASEDASLASLLRDPVMLREWRLAGLPTDDVSTTNSLIIRMSRRSPLMIDPQHQANAFIRNLGEKRDAGLDVLDAGARHLHRTLETAIRYGKWVLLENVGEVIDHELLSVLSCQTVSLPGASGRFMRVGEAVVPYNPAFRLFLTTTLPNPHFTPEVCSNACVLNFSLTEGGLEEQMLTTVISREVPTLEERKAHLSMARTRMEMELNAVESKILALLSNTTDTHLLDDVDLIQALGRAKETAHDIKTKIEESEETGKEIDASRDHYRSVAGQAAVMFFVVYNMRGIDPMYQFSLAWFKKLFDKCIVETPRSDDRDVRIAAISSRLAQMVYGSVCRSLFEKHKLLFAFLMAVGLQRKLGAVDSTEWRFLLSGQVSTEVPAVEARFALNPDTTFINAKGWREVLHLSQLPAFDGLHEHLHMQTSRWAEWAEGAAEGLCGKLIAPYDKLDGLQQLCLLRALRPDAVVSAMQQYVGSVLGEAFLEFPMYNLAASFDTSSAMSPLVFIVSSGTDPLEELTTFASDRGMLRNFKTVSLGQGQGNIAKSLITEGAVRGHWVLLMNCHLFTSWLDKLRALVEGLREDGVHRNFRLWLTSEPTQHFPVSVLQRSVKMTMERPTGLRANLQAIYDGFSKDLFFDQSSPRTFGKLLYALCFFHASVLERRRFGPLGWNKVYDFSDSDLAISRQQLELFLGRYSDVPFDVLNEMIGGINYGGRITDDKDLRTAGVVLRGLFQEKVLVDGQKLSRSGTYTSLPYDDDQPLRAYQKAIAELPVSTQPEAFGMHSNASITVARSQAYGMFNWMLSLQPKEEAKAGGVSRDDTIKELAAGVLKRLPRNFDTEAISLAYPVSYRESMNGVLVQEAVQYNRLLSVMRASLQELQLAIEGRIVMSTELEHMCTSLWNNWVPAQWAAVAYPSLKALAAWEQELLARISFLRKWVRRGAPPSFWLPGFFFPQAFLTGTLQNYARKRRVPIDTVSFSFLVHDDVAHPEDVVDRPEDGCFVYGLHLEGGAWNQEKHRISRAAPRELFPALPMVHLLPVANQEQPVRGVYRCPVYKTLARHGVLSTTGHSTNFIMWMVLPATGNPIQRPALVSEVGADVVIGDMVADTEEWIKAGVAAFCSLRY